MSFLKLNGGICAGLATLAMLTGNPQIAQASEKTLVCNNSEPPNMNGWHDTGPITLDLNETQGTVMLHMPPTIAPGQSEFKAPTPSGPLPATFTPGKITFSWHERDSPHIDHTYAVNRQTGIVEQTYAIDPGPTIHITWTCQVGKAKF